MRRGVASKVWQASWVLLEYLSSNSKILAGKLCIELGSGTCFCARYIAQNMPVKQVIATDMDDSYRQEEEEEDLVKKRWLDWRDEESIKKVVETLNKDDDDVVVVASDCMYDEDMVISFVSCLVRILKHGSNSSAILVDCVRDAVVYEKFLKELQKQELVEVEEITEKVAYSAKRIFHEVGRCRTGIDMLDGPVRIVNVSFL